MRTLYALASLLAPWFASVDAFQHHARTSHSTIANRSLLHGRGGAPFHCPESQRSKRSFSVSPLGMFQNDNERDNEDSSLFLNKIRMPFAGETPQRGLGTNVRRSVAVGLASLLLSLTVMTTSQLSMPMPAQAATTPADSANIVGCLFKKCSTSLAKCIANPRCFANIVCINTCTGRPDEIDCQISCGNLFENDVVGDFNKCAISDMSCVPKQQDDGSYPIPTDDIVVPKFSTALFNGRWYITAGQNKLFDTFPCQVHFFTETEPGKFFGKLNWRIEEPDGEFFTRNALQEFVQDPKQPSHLVNDGNEYLHYSDEWWIIDYEYDNNPSGVPPFAFVYYRGSNDAWDGYGGVVVYTRDAALPESLLPRLREDAKKVNFDFDRDFTITDNSCPAELSEGQKRLLRQKFAGKVFLQTEEQLQAEATRLRGNAANSLKAQKLFFENRLDSATKAYEELEESTATFEREATDSSP